MQDKFNTNFDISVDDLLEQIRKEMEEKDKTTEQMPQTEEIHSSPMADQAEDQKQVEQEPEKITDTMKEQPQPTQEKPKDGNDILAEFLRPKGREYSFNVAKKAKKEIDGLFGTAADEADAPATGGGSSTMLSAEEINNLSNFKNSSHQISEKDKINIQRNITKLTATDETGVKPSGFKIVNHITKEDETENDKTEEVKTETGSERTIVFDPVSTASEKEEAVAGNTIVMPVIQMHDDFITESQNEDIEDDIIDEIAANVATAVKESGKDTKRREIPIVADNTEPVFEDDDPSDETENEKFIEDYRTIEDAEPIRYDLEARLRRLSGRTTVSAICFIALALLTLLPSLDISLPSFISPSENTMLYLIICTAVFAIGIISNFGVILHGIASLFKLSPDADTTLTVSAIISAVQIGMSFMSPERIASGDIHLFAGLTLFAMMLNCMGKRSMQKRIMNNFKLVATNSVKQSCFVADDASALKMSEGSTIGQPYTVCSKSVINLKDYLYNSYCEDPSDSMCRTLTPIGIIAAIIAGVAMYYLESDALLAVSVATAVSALSVPVCSLLSINMPLGSAAKAVREEGGILSGYNAVDEFADAECVAFDAEELFQPGSVELVNLKAVGENAVDNVILDAAALTIAAGGPLCDVFDKIIEGRTKILPEVEELYYDDMLGITAKVGGIEKKLGTREYIGNLSGMPDIELERKAQRKGCHTVYLSSGEELIGIFVIRYHADDITSEYLDMLTRKGVMLLIKTNDANITPELIEQTFDIPKEYVKIMSSYAACEFDNVTKATKSGSAVFAHDNSVSALALGIVAVKKLRKQSITAVVLQVISVVLGFGAALFLALTGDLNYIVPHVLFAYQLISTIIVLGIPALGGVRRRKL